MTATRRPMPDSASCQQFAEKMMSYAIAAGANAAEVLVRDGAELEVKIRLGEAEMVKEAQSRALGLRVVKDHRVAVTYTSDFSDAGLRDLAAQTVELANLSEEDPLSDLPAASDLARAIPSLDLWDDEVARLEAPELLQRAIRAEAAARGSDARISNSNGASFSRVMGASAFASSAGFSGGYVGTFASLAVMPIADDADGKKRNGSYYTASRFAKLLLDDESVGVEAARRTIAKLGARKVETCQAPVVFSAEATRSLIGKLVGCTSGGAIWRRSSYLAERLNSQVASSLISIADDPLIPRGPGSRPFDGEGLASRVNVILDGGVLRTFLCDTYAGRKLGRPSTGSAGRGIGGSAHVSTTNLLMRAGSTPNGDLEKIERGLYVTDLMGFGWNAVTGDFSQGAGGFWIENGERAFPVSEVTISAHFDDLWKGVDMVGNEVDVRSSIQCPPIRTARMTIGGR